MKKLVDGVEIEMTNAEIALKQAQDKALKKIGHFFKDESI